MGKWPNGSAQFLGSLFFFSFSFFSSGGRVGRQSSCLANSHSTIPVRANLCPTFLLPVCWGALLNAMAAAALQLLSSCASNQKDGLLSFFSP